MTKRRPPGLSIVQQLLGDIQAPQVAIGIVIGLLLFPLVSYISASVDDFLRELVPEFVGIVFTVLILENLARVREKRQLTEQLIRRMQSRFNPTALSAIEELRVYGKLQDGTVRNRNLRGSNWENANLYQADLRGCDLTNAILKHADFVYANLEGVTVTEEQLVCTDNLCGATMPDGSRYDGRYVLPGDLNWARRKGVNLNSPEEMAAFYGVPVEAYISGQTWWAQNRHRFRDRSEAYDPNDPLNQPLPT